MLSDTALLHTAHQAWEYAPDPIEEPEDMTIHEFYYYHRDEEAKPLVTVCLLKFQGDFVARGVAICSLRDCPSKRTGRTIARGRARKAMINKKSSEPTHYMSKAFPTLAKADPHITMKYLEKSTFNPTLTPLEKELFGQEVVA